MKNLFAIALLALSPFCYGASIDLGTHDVTPACAENPCTTYRFAPFCVDSTNDGVCDGYPAKAWTVSSAISSVPAACNAGDDANANPDIHPVFAATLANGSAISTLGLAINSATGAITGTPNAKGSGTITVTCTNDLGTRSDTLAYNVDPSPTTTAQKYHLDCQGGNDANNGTSHAQRVLTVARAKTLIGSTVGADLYLLEGSNCNAQVVASWGGTAADHAVVGSYRFSGTEIYGSPISKPTLTGTYAASCSPTLGGTGVCPVGIGSANNPAAIPTNQNAGLVEVTADYTDIQDLGILSSSGVGALVNVSVSGVTGITRHNVRFLNLTVTRTASSGIYCGRTDFCVMRDNVVTYDKVADNKADRVVTGGGSCIAIGRNFATPVANVYALIENNQCINGFGEGFIFIGGNFAVMRGNTVMGTAAVNIYTDNFDYLVVEQNQSYGSNSNTVHNTAKQRGLSLSTEDAPNPAAFRRNITHVIVRNNLIANTSTCFGAAMEPGWASGGWKHGPKFLGNTCLAQTSAYVSNSMTGGLTNTNIDPNFEVVDNVFDKQTVTSPTCNNYGSLADFHHNGWSVTPTDPDCVGTGDVVGSSGITAGFTWTTAGIGNIPSLANWVPGASAEQNAGTAEVASFATGTEWDWATSSMTWTPSTCPAGGAALSATNWKKYLFADYCNVTRSGSTPDMGAREQ